VNCFGGKHELKDCTSTRNCNKLRGRHHTSLCDMETSESQIQQHRQAS
jgi:hypothetical protein